VIVGAGQAADQAVYTLRRRGFTEGLVLVGDEPRLPYQRPPLSKKFLAGTLDPERLALRAPQFYEEHAVRTHLGARAEEILRREQRIRLDDGSTIAYDVLILATGSHPRRLQAPGANLLGVHYLRTIADVERIRTDLRDGRRLVVVGGGYIGLEVAATARELGAQVTVLEIADRVMNRVTCSAVSAFYEAEHSRHGVRIVRGSTVHMLVGDSCSGRVRGVITEDATEYAADLVVVGVGALPTDGLAVASGLECSNGITINNYCCTSDPMIYAAGDCTSQVSLHYDRRVRLESVDNAVEQGLCAALNILGGDRTVHKVPWFWSDQYDLKLVIVGLSQGHDEVVLRGEAASRSFSACYLRQGELIAVDAINRPKDQVAARQLIASRARPNLEKLANINIPLRDAM